MNRCSLKEPVLRRVEGFGLKQKFGRAERSYLERQLFLNKHRRSKGYCQSELSFSHPQKFHTHIRVLTEVRFVNSCAGEQTQQ